MLVVAATERELDFVDGFETLCCGIGPVEAALATARRLADHTPTAVLHIGIAGAKTIEPPALVLGSESIYCDVIDPASVLPRVERVGPDAALLVAARSALPEAHVLPIATSARVGGGTSCEVEAIAKLIQVDPSAGRWHIDDALALLRDSVPRLLEILDA